MKMKNSGAPQDKPYRTNNHCYKNTNTNTTFKNIYIYTNKHLERPGRAHIGACSMRDGARCGFFLASFQPLRGLRPRACSHCDETETPLATSAVKSSMCTAARLASDPVCARNGDPPAARAFTLPTSVAAPLRRARAGRLPGMEKGGRGT